MSAKTIFVLYLFITLFLFECLKESECSSDGHNERKYSQLGGTSLSLQVQKPARTKRSPCIVGTRWRTRRCRRRGKRTLTKTQMVSFSLLIVRIKPCSPNCNSCSYLYIAVFRFLKENTQQ